jgi:hypothetical protein
MVFIGGRRKEKVVYVKGKGRLSVAEDKLLPAGKGLSCRQGRETSIRRRIKLRQIKRIPYILSPWDEGNVSAWRSVKLQFPE